MWSVVKLQRHGACDEVPDVEEERVWDSRKFGQVRYEECVVEIYCEIEAE